MRIHPIPLIAGLLFSSLFSFAQKEEKVAIQFRSGEFIPEMNIDAESLGSFNARLPKIFGKSFAVLQFEKIPTSQQKQDLLTAGITLLEYIPHNSYTISFTGNLQENILQNTKARAVFEMSPMQKMHPVMAKGVYPSWSLKTAGMMDVWISFPKTLTFEEIKSLLNDKRIQITSTTFKDLNIIGLKIALHRIIEVASLPYVEYIQPVPDEDKKLNAESRNNSRGSLLNAASAVGGFDLKGEGVTTGVGDNADPQYHADFTGRLYNFGSANYVHHGTHVAGTVGGGGIVNELYVGYAPKAKIVNQYFGGIINNTPSYVTDYNMVVTNNSYGNVLGDCSYMGYYDLQSRILDLQADSYPNLQHVFAAGNDGSLTCSPYPTSFGTVLSSYQSAKNIIAVGATGRTGTVTWFSSRGPVKDGRLKPEIMADGLWTISSYPDDIYGAQQGTSMAAPGVSGGLTLLYQRYRQLNAGADPKNGLMKALICNGGSDLGNTGPDYTYGFGWMNLWRSVDMLNNGRYIISSVGHSGSNDHNINVPSGTAILKVMLYWNDPAAAVFASQTLVNDLDMEIETPPPGPVTLFPYILDTIPGNVNNTATTGADHINNIEQIVIVNPISTGNHKVTVKGTSVPSGPQEYFLVYDFIPTETKLVYPVGGEALNPGETITIQWESYGDPANTFTVEYSTNNGSSWTTISSSVAAGLRQLAWVVPSVQTDQALIRVTRNGTGLISTSSVFTIIGVPTLSLAATQCEGYFSFSWTAVTGATDYEVFQLQGTEMVSIGTTTSTSYILSGLSPSIEYWATVCARFSGKRGRRAHALKRTPSTGSCAGSISDYDIRLDSIVAPVYGRVATSTALTTTTTVSARIKNLDDANVTGFDIRYRVGAGAWNTESVSITVNPGATYTHNFATPYDFSAAGEYILTVEVINTVNTDPVSANNSITDTIRQFMNDVITLPFTDDLETGNNRSYYKNRFGLQGIDRYDYTKISSLGRLSTYLSAGMARSGTKSLILDLDGWDGASGNSNFVYGTYNLSGIDANDRDLRLDFQFKSHGDSVSHANNSVWIRGNDTQPWVEVFKLSNNLNVPGVFKRSPSLEISDFLVNAGQNFGSSFQVRWGQYGLVRVIDNFGFQGHNFDDIRIYEAIDDIQLISIDTPIVSSCGLNNAVPVIITIKNASPDAINNIPVRFVINGTTTVNETIVLPAPGLAANTSYQYTFSATADLSAPGTHSVFANTLYPTDDFNENDTTTVFVINSPVISSFPHIQNFESGSGDWYTSGTNSSWEHGTPGATKINRAASGTKAWKTGLTGGYNDNELSYLNSPCYDISSMSNPTLSFMAAMDIEDCGGVFCDGVYVEYSADGKSWSRLGSVGSGTNWYNRNYSGSPMWSVENYTRWHVVTTSLPAGLSNLRLRIVVNSDPFIAYEGIAIDDIHIYDNTDSIYNDITMGSPVNETISGGTNWVHFRSGGKLVASVQPNNQNLGSTDVQAYINTGGVRNDGKQYYHDRNITIKPTNVSLADSAIVRFYFLDSETENLINASSCPTCTKPASAIELGVTKYSDPDDNFENGTIADNLVNGYSFISVDWNNKVPFDKGYYIEYRVKDFSEFWLNNGAFDKQTPLPAELISFTAKKKNKTDVLAEWVTATEYNVNRYELEVAKGNTDYQNNRFVKIAEIRSPGNSNSQRQYSYTDIETGKHGVYYYRLKIIDQDNSFVYSAIRPVMFNEQIQLQVYPNPSAGIFNLVYQLNKEEIMLVKIYDTNGRLIRQVHVTGTGFLQKTHIDLQSSVYASGVYHVLVSTGDQQQSIRLVKQ